MGMRLLEVNNLSGVQQVFNFAEFPGDTADEHSLRALLGRIIRFTRS